jgi:hypothetical protein
MDMLLATDFFTHEVWGWFGLVIASLLCFLHCGRHNVCAAGRTLHDSLRWMLLCLLRSLNVHTLRERGVRVVQQAALSRLILCGQGGRRPPLSAFPTGEDRGPIPQGRGKVVRMPAVHARQIRDGPMHYRHRDEMLNNIHCAAA